MSTTYLPSVPEVFVNVDRDKVLKQGLDLGEVYKTLQTFMGGYFVNYFNRFGRQWQVYVEADDKYRASMDNLGLFYVRNRLGQSVPLSAVARVERRTGPEFVMHYNEYRCAQINGSAAPGYSSDQATKALEEVFAKTMPAGMGFDYFGMSFQEQQAAQGVPRIAIFGLSLVFVFLILAALYESWSLPFSVLISTPVAVLGAFLALWSRHFENNVYVQIGLIMLIGLSAKNAILDRRIRQDRSRKRQVPDRGRADRRAHPVAADPDDLLRLRFRLPAAVVCHRFGRDVAPDTGHGRHRRDAGFDLAGHIHHPGQFLRGGETGHSMEEAPARTATGRRENMSVPRQFKLWRVMIPTLFLAGCAAGPNFHPPKTEVSAAFANGSQTNMIPAPTAVTWWQGFNDAILNRLVAQAVTNNPDLRIATAHVLEARALRMGAVADLFPVANANAGWTKSLASQDSEPLPAPRSEREFSLYNAGFDATWELDLFGHVRRAVQADTADLAATIATRQDVLVTLISEVARNYFELRGAQNQLAVARGNVANERETLDLALAKLKGGRATELDTARARAQLDATLALIPPIEAAIQHSIHRLSVLTGQQPNALESELAPAAPIPTLPLMVNIGNPADLLRRRPDIRSAESSLAAATARIGVETSDLFPRVTFNGNLGVQASEVSGLFKSGADTYSFGPSITWAALDLGHVLARMKAANARADAQLASYEKTVLNALEETENALVDFGHEQVRRDYLRESDRSATEAMKLARQRYDGGVDDFLPVLDAQRAQLLIQAQLAQSETRTATSLVAIYKALGGGWEIAPVPTVSQRAKN